MADTIPSVGQGPAKIASVEDTARDNVGFTNPNLHRNVDSKTPIDPNEVSPREYMFYIESLDSYRMTDIITHDEDSTTREIP